MQDLLYPRVVRGLDSGIITFCSASFELKHAALPGVTCFSEEEKVRLEVDLLILCYGVNRL